MDIGSNYEIYFGSKFKIIFNRVIQPSDPTLFVLDLELSHLRVILMEF